MGFQFAFWTFLLGLASYGLPVYSQLTNISASNNEVVKILSKEKRKTRFWSVTTVLDRKLTDNQVGRVYVGNEAALFRLHVPGLYGNSSSQTVSLQFLDLSELFVRVDVVGHLHLDRRDVSEVFNKSATFKVLESHGGIFYLSSLLFPGLDVSITASCEVSMSSNRSLFQAIVPDDVESLTINTTGLTYHSWVTTKSDLDLNSFDIEKVISNLPNVTSNTENILPYTLNTHPKTVYRIQGYWRPYFDGLYSFHVRYDSQYQVKVELHNRTVKFVCGHEQICSPLFFYGGSTHAYYYVNLLVYSGNMSGVFNFDIYTHENPLKFADFRKFDDGRGESDVATFHCQEYATYAKRKGEKSHRWTFDTPCSPSCWDELQVASLVQNVSDTLIARYLILDDKNFMSRFSVGFWLSRSDRIENVTILSYGDYFHVRYKSRSADLSDLYFHVGEDRYVISTSKQVVHVLFTWARLRGAHCYINGQITKSNHTLFFPKSHHLLWNRFSVANPVNVYFNLTELVLWSTDMTSEQVLEEYHVSCHVYPSTCRWKNIRQYPDEWLLGSGKTPSSPFTGPYYSPDDYFYIEGSLMDYNSSAILLSPNIVSAYQCLRFQYFMFGAGIGRLSVYARYERHIDILWTLVGAQNRRYTDWKMASVNLSSLDKSAWKKIEFHAVRGENFRSDIAISDLKLHVEECQTEPESAATSCPCPSDFPCTKDAEICHCDTRQANFVDQFCLDDIKHLFHNASYYWSMDNATIASIEAEMVTGVANKAIYVKRKGGKIAAPPLLNNFSVSMWTKIDNGTKFVFRIQRVLVNYFSDSGVNIIITPNYTSFCYLLQYKWPINLFLHMGIVTLQNTPPYIELYKNGNLQTPYNFGPSLCDSSDSSKDPRRVAVFPGNTYDDLAIWTRRLNKMEIQGIFLRYEKYKAVDGYYALQPVIFNIQGLWTENYAENVADKDGLVSEEVQRGLYNELLRLKMFVQDITATTDINVIPKRRPANITIFMSGVAWPDMSYWRRLWMKSRLIEKSWFAGIVKDYTVTSRYVSDTAPYKLTVLDINATSFNLSWEFTFKEKLSPFQGFGVFVKNLHVYSLRSTLYETTACEAVVVGLAPFTSYLVHVLPRHLVGSGFISDGITVQTSGSVPSVAPQNIEVNAVSSTSLEIKWSPVPSQHRNGIITGYIILIAATPINESKKENITIPLESKKVYLRTDLKKYHFYWVKIAATTSVGRGVWSDWIRTRTLTDAPSAAPQNFTGVSNDHQSVTFTWHEVPTGDWNSPSIEYLLRCCNTSDVTCKNRTISGGRTNFTLTGLTALVPYNCSLSAFNDQGKGPSIWLEVTTMQVCREPLQSITTTNVTARSISLHWNNSRLSDHDSVLYFEYCCLSCSPSDCSTVQFNITNTTNTTIDGLFPYQCYSIYVYEVSDVSGGKCGVNFEVKTEEDVPTGFPENLTVIETSSLSLLLTWAPITEEDRNGVIVGYDVFIFDDMDHLSETARLNGSDQLMFEKRGLKEYYRYTISVAGRTSVGLSYSDRWGLVEISNLGEVPPPPAQNITVVATSSTSLRMSWSFDMLQQFLRVLDSFEINLTDVLENTTRNFTQYNATKLVFLIDGLKKYHNYSVRLAVRSEGGVSEFSPWFGVKTLEDSPCFAPGRFRHVLFSQTLKLVLVWSPLNSSAWCGEPRGYQISYGLESMPTVNYTALNVSHDVDQFVLPDNLTRFVQYNAYVAAFTTAGLGPSALRKFYMNGVPTIAPVIHSIVTIDSTSLGARWSGISRKNGKEKGYIIKVRCLGCGGIFAKPKQFNIGVRYFFVLTGLNVYSNYSVQIAAYNQYGEGNFSAPVFAVTDEAAPGKAPSNVSSISTGPNNLTVFWPHLDNTWGEIIYYRVHLYTEMFGQMLNVRHQTTMNNYLTFVGLSEGTEYEFDVYGATRKGKGPFSVKHIGRTLSGDAEFCPSNISLFNATSTSVQITWKALNSNLVPGGLPSYEILYRIDREGFPREVRVTNTRSTRTAFRLQRLEESVTYWIAVRAYVVGPTGNNGIPQCHEYNITTKDDAPDAAPVDISEASVTSTSITVNWKPIPLTYMNGVLLGYRLNYSLTTPSSNSRTKRDATSNENQIHSVTVGPDKHSYVIEDLRKFTTYSIIISGYNRNGDGPYSQHVNILTAEDVPSRAPTNLRTVNKTSTTSLRLLWDPIPQDYVHGILTGYTVRYKAFEQGVGIKLISQFHTVNVPPNVNMADIPNLASYTRYKFSMFAKTKVGGGVFSKTVVGETCRCHRNMSTNWWEIRPYIGSEEDSSVTGVFPIVLRNMVTSCCQSCGAHKSTTVEFLTEVSVRNSLEDVRNAINENDLSFPVYGSSDQDQYGSFYGYVPVISSPGEAFVVHREPKRSSTDVLVATVLSCWPMVILSAVFSTLAGVVIWLLECRSNSEQFPPTFLPGVYQGIWWAFVTSSTVGYGDRRPKTIGGKLFAVVWTLTGQIVILILTSLVAGQLTTYSLKIDRSLYGKQVAAILNSPQYNFAIRRNAKVEQISYNVEDMISTLKERKVDGLVVDTYVAGARKQLFSEYFRVRKVFDHKSAYGVVLAGDAMKLHTCFTKYIKENRGMIFEELRKVVEAIEEPKLSESLTRSTKLFDPYSSQTTKSLVYCVAILSVLVVASLLYEGNRRRRNKTKVEPNEVRLARRKLNEDTKREIRQFASKVTRLCLRIRQKHKQELITLNEMKKSLQSEKLQINSTELAHLGQNSGFPSVE